MEAVGLEGPIKDHEKMSWIYTVGARTAIEACSVFFFSYEAFCVGMAILLSCCQTQPRLTASWLALAASLSTGEKRDNTGEKKKKKSPRTGIRTARQQGLALVVWGQPTSSCYKTCFGEGETGGDDSDCLTCKQRRQA